VRAATRTALAPAGIAPERLAFLPYSDVDIVLDPFPYNGMTTTGDAFWMGVPVVALRGASTLSRASFSLLSNIGHPEFAADSEDGSVRIATDLVGDLARHATLRKRLHALPLLGPPRFAGHLEAACRMMWQTCCSSAA
jgi:predicted O-linked N-acetylglucosamine transferase (SPINDLY family)